MKDWTVFVLLAWLLLSSSPTQAQSPEEVLRQARLISESTSTIMTVQMSIHMPEGVKERGMEIYVQNDEGVIRVLVQIVEPAFLRNMKFLEHRYPGDREDKWLKTSRGVRRLSHASYSERLFDSDFTVEDLSRIDVEDFHLFFSSLGDESAARTIVAEPLRGGRKYARKEFTIDRETNLVTRVNYYEADGQLSRRYTLIEARNINGVSYPWCCIMEDLHRNSSTTLSFQSIEVVDSLPARLFNKAAL